MNPDRPSRDLPNAGGRGAGRRPGPVGPRPGPGPGRPRPVPWSPFGPGDTASPDSSAVAARAAAVKSELEKVRMQLTGMRHGPGPDGTPPVVRELSRTEGLWPYLVIRHGPGDTGARPLGPRTIYDIENHDHDSPDIIVTRASPGGPTEVGRDGIDALMASAVGMSGSLSIRKGPYPIDIWVHVWNLGRGAATGARIRVYDGVQGAYLGGRQVNLAERGREGCHRLVKVGSATETEHSYGYRLVTAVVECISDTASGDRTPGMDRHCGHRVLLVVP